MFELSRFNHIKFFRLIDLSSVTDSGYPALLSLSLEGNCFIPHHVDNLNLVKGLAMILLNFGRGVV